MTRYDIPTLLALSQNAHIDINRFSAQTLGYDLLRQHKAEKSVLSERPVNQSRNTSNISRQSHELRSTSGSRLRNPSRQPSDPPQGALAQADAGFARFLKEHASPKHQRVTAGGRIVPMDLQNPAPKMKLPVDKHTPGERGLSTMTQGQGKNRIKDKQTKAVDLNPHPDNSASPQPRGVLATHARLSSMNGKCDLQAPVSNSIPDLQSAVLGSAMLLQPNVTIPLVGHQFPQAEQQSQEVYAPVPLDQVMYNPGGYPLVWFPNLQASASQGAVPSFMSSASHAQPSGLVTPSEFASCSSLLGRNPSTLGHSSSIPGSFVSTPGVQGYQSIGSLVATANQPLLSSVPFLESSLWKSLNQITTDYASLSTELTGLDRYMAMHTWDLDPRAKKSLVEQRKSLVRELDVVRSYKEQLEATLGVSNSSGTQKVTIAGVSGASNTRLPESSVSNQFLTGMPASALHHPISGFPLSTPGSTLPSLLSVNPPLDLGCQWQGNQEVGAFGSYLATQEVPPHWDLSRQSKGPDRSQSSGAGVDLIEPTTVPVATNVGEAGEDDGWTSFSTGAPFEIRNIYNKIEDATRKGEPIDHLLKELSRVTTQLMLQYSHSSDSPAHQAISLFDKQAYQSEDCLREPLSRDLLDRSGAYRPVTRPSRRPWASENLIQKPSIRLRETSFKTDEDADGESTSSFTTTTDSWATVCSEDKHSINRNPFKSEQSEVNPETRQRISKSHRSPSFAAAEVGARTPSLSKASGPRLRSSCEDALKPHPSASANGLDGSGARLRAQNGRQANPQLLTQYLSKDRGLTLQKATPLAVSQNVNAHAFLPPLDGILNRPYLGIFGHVDDKLQIPAQCPK